MRSLKTSIIAVVVLLFLLSTISNRVASSQSAEKPATGQANVATNSDDVQKQCPIDREVIDCTFCVDPTEAPTGLDDKTNDLVGQDQHDKDRETFEIRDKILPDAIQGGGLGPVYNAQSCAECHQNPVTGAVSQINELRAGHLEQPGGIHPCLACPPIFVDAPGGSLINDRAIDPRIQERVPPLFSAGIDRQEDIRTTRTSLNTMGDGFVEAISNTTLLEIAKNQPYDSASGGIVQGQTINVPIEELPPNSSRICRVGRFGHKDQHASLLSFSGDAYLNEIGITNRLFLKENTSLGRFVGFGSGFDPLPDNTPCNDDPSVICGEDKENDIDAFTQFMRATKAPSRDKELASSEKAQIGEKLFHEVGCAVCHVSEITTALPGTVINGGTFTVPDALGNKIIHPYGDFLLHDIGTGDGIVQNGGQSTRLKVRTAPLWGVRTHTRLMHDSASLTFMESIERHAGEAEIVLKNFNNLSSDDQTLVIIFLESL
ncbi:MAG: hypothetical protein QOC99_1886 [Acidobacteriota bacterium]|jgi:mono/diheme cytochrome c family protein|nr:hypothetical protein [Acidobacteriota bacterium]